MKLIILNINPYKEKDAIITAISENELISFTARGLFSEKSKFKSLNVPLSVAEVEFSDGNYKYPIMKTATILSSPLSKETNIEYLTSINIITECTRVLLGDEEKHLMFNYLISTINGLKKSDKYLLIVLNYMCQILKIAGYEFELKECVNCGTKKDIVAFSFIEGGFLCRKCLDNEFKADLTVNQMLLLRKVYLIEDVDTLTNIDYEEYDAKVLMDKFYEYIYDNFGMALKSYKTL